MVAAALKAQPGSPDALINYGVILDALKRHQEALASFDKVLSMRSRCHGAYNRGNALHGLGRHAEALTSYDRALSLAPGHVEALFNRGNTLAALDRHADALGDYDAVLALGPRHSRKRSTVAALRCAR